MKKLPPLMVVVMGGAWRWMDGFVVDVVNDREQQVIFFCLFLFYCHGWVLALQMCFFYGFAIG